MNLLVLAGAYPHAGHPFSGTFNEKCSLALKDHCKVLEVLSPRPFVPSFLGFHPRWRAYRFIPSFEIRDGISISRPAVPVLPRVASSFWIDAGAYFFLRRAVRKRHSQSRFDAIMSFNLVETGGIAWRLAKDLGIPASGWAFGEDVRHPRSSPLAGVVRRALQNLNLVFYQSEELLERGKELLGVAMTGEIAKRHKVLAHGIPKPPVLAHEKVRREVRGSLGIAENEILVLNVSRVTRLKGIFELLDAFALAVASNPLLRCVWVGAKPGFDDSQAVQNRIQSTPALQGKFTLLPACSPDRVWEYLCAADIYAFPSHREGISNSLLEAMVMKIPAVVFAIPANCEIDTHADALLMAPMFDVKVFSEHLTSLSLSLETRRRLGKSGGALVEDRFQVDRNMARALQNLADVALGTA